jgi:subtilisin family serine protease
MPPEEVVVKRSLQALALAAASLVAAGCSSDSSGPAEPALAAGSVAGATGNYIIVARSEHRVTPALLREIAAAGGTVVRQMPRMGVVVASSDKPDFLARMRASAEVETAAPDRMVQWQDPNQRVRDHAGEVAAPDANVNHIGSNEPFFFLQWAHQAIHSGEAWDAGARGAGIRVAILDGGLYNAHPDLAAGVDVARSASMVPGQPYNNDTGTFWHGTHVAGIVGARDNQLGVIGVAPGATLIGVKVLHNGSGSFDWVMNGIYYAATPIAEGGAGAHVINMSLGARFLVENEDDMALVAAMSRATNYAYNRGVTVVVSAGNDAVNTDANPENEVIIPAQSNRTVTVSALGPLGWAYGATNYDRQASYTNWGSDLVDVSAPGGDFAYPGNESCNVGGIVTACWVFDMYLSTSRAGYSWAAGTSMAAPTVSGVVAIILEQNGPLSPIAVAAALRRTSDDLGPIGFDALYGWGRVNSANAASALVASN